VRSDPEFDLSQIQSAYQIRKIIDPKTGGSDDACCSYCFDFFMPYRQRDGAVLRKQGG
jgi:hypothetical protein